MKIKRMPLLILGKRQSGKTTALEGLINKFDNLKDKNYKNCLFIDGFIHQNIKEIPRNAQIIALTDDIDNFVEIMKKLRDLGYPVKERKRGMKNE